MRAVYTMGREKLIGLFAVGSGPVSVDTGLPDGLYRDENSAGDIYVFHGVVPVGEEPVVLAIGDTFL